MNRLRTLDTPAVRRTVAALMVLAGVWWFTRSVPDWGQVARATAAIGPGPILLALCCLLLAGAAAMLSWDAVLGCEGSIRERSRIFFVGQLGKYLPGSVWTPMIQAQLARRVGAGPRDVLVAFAATFGISVLAAASLGWPAAVASWGGAGYLALGAVAVLPLVLAPPAVAVRLLRRLTGVTHVPGAYRRCLGWAILGWIVAGSHLAVLAVASGADPWQALMVCIPATALAVGAGSLVVFAPGGIGVREVVLLGALSSLLDPATAAAIALISRGTSTIADLLLAGWALTGRRATGSSVPGTPPRPSPVTKESRRAAVR